MGRLKMNRPRALNLSPMTPSMQDVPMANAGTSTNRTEDEESLSIEMERTKSIERDDSFDAARP